jgi:hypothetical protein
MSSDLKLIFTLSNHPILGFIIEAYRVQVLQSGQWSMDLKKISDENSQYLNFALSYDEKDLLDEIQTTREENVYAQFSLLKEKKILPNKTYFSPQTISKHLVPYVSKHTSVIVSTIIEKRIPLYLKNADKNSIEENPIFIEDDVAEPRFFFNFENNKLAYNLELYLQNTLLNLSEAAVICHKPGFILVNRRLISLPHDFDGQLLKPFVKTKEISIPQEKVQVYLQTFVSKIIRKYRADVKGFSVEEQRPAVKPILGLSKVKKKKPVLTLNFEYAGELFFANSIQEFSLKLVSEKNKISFIKTFRDLKAEKLMHQQLVSAGFYMVLPGMYTCWQGSECLPNYQVADLLYEVSKKIKTLKDYGFVFDLIVDDKRFLVETPTINTVVSQRNDWFDLKMNIQFDKFTIPFTKIIPNIIKGDPVFLLPDGNFVILPHEWFSRFKDLVLLSEKSNGTIQIHKAQYNLIANEAFVKSDFPDKFKKLINHETSTLPQPGNLKASLRPYQKNGFEWMMKMYSNGLGACLADDMGLGKTVQVLSYFLKLKEDATKEKKLMHVEEESAERGQINLFKNDKDMRMPHTHLVVVPLSLIHNWQDEIQKFAPSLSTIVYSGSERYRLYHYFAYADVVLTSYGIIRNDADVLKHFDFHTIILDESQFIKNPDSKSYDSLMMMSSKQRFVLSGTPIENSLLDIWTQMNFLNKGMLGTLKSFKDMYVIPVEKMRDVEASYRIQKLIGSFILRRTKDQVAPELPPMTEKICYCTMTAEQKSLYEHKKSEIRNFLIENAGFMHRGKRNMVVLSGLMKLRLIANHPKLTDPEFKGKSGKFDDICSHIDKVVSEGHKTIVFSQFVKHLDIVREYLNKKGIEYEVLTGKTTQSQRKINIEKFKKDNNVHLFLMTLKAGGVGLNLTEADYVFVIDPWWNPATESQAINRTHRIGQDKKVFAYRFISSETIEEKIMILKRKKTDIFESIINTTTLSKLTDDEILKLFE